MMGKAALRLTLLFALVVLAIGLGTNPALALYPPCQGVSTSYDAATTTVSYSAIDPITFLANIDSWSLSQGDQRAIESIQVDQGIVTWVARYRNWADADYIYEVHYRIYDPGRGMWKGGFWGPFASGWQREISQHQVKDGVVAWKTKNQKGVNPTDPLEYRVCYVTYEPASGSWPLGEDSYTTDLFSGISPENLRVKDGVVTWPMNPLNSTNIPLPMRIYDRELLQWVRHLHNVRFIGEFDWVEIVNGTIHLQYTAPIILGGEEDMFWNYDPFNHTWAYTYGEEWPAPIRRASFVVQPAFGFTPTVVCYWDTSFALYDTGIWTYTFGDGQVSTNRSWVHPYYYAGHYNVNMQVYFEGNIYQAGSKPVDIVDYTPPTGGIVINGGDAYTNSLNVTLSLNYDANARQMCFMSNPGFLTWSGWEDVAPSKSWQMSGLSIAGGSMDGVKTVYVKFRDENGFESSQYADSIILDTTPPAPMLVVNYGIDTTTNPQVRAEWNAVDANGVAEMRYSAVNVGYDVFFLWGPWMTYEYTVMTIPFNSTPGEKLVMVEFMDVAGNVTQTFDSTMLVAVPTPDTGIQITGITSNLGDTVQVGDTVQFTVQALTSTAQPINYQFFCRAGYGEPGWGGNTWQMVRDWSSATSANITFDAAGTYFVAVHAEHQGNSWEAGDPQGGIAVEVSDPLGTGIQITAVTTNLVDNVRVGDTLQLIVNALTSMMGTINYQFFCRAGYGEPGWGGNTWQMMRDWSSSNSANITFDTPGTYFVSVHAEHQGNSWEAGDPQGGIAVEVSAAP